MSGVDVLAVMESAAWLAESEINRRELEEARAAVAELIEADIAYDAAMTKRHSRAYLDCAPIKQRRIQEWLVNASKRRAAALSRVRDAE